MPDDFLDRLRSVIANLPADHFAAEPPDPVVERGETVLAIFRHGKREQLRVVLDEFCGKRFATVRVWFRDPEDREVYLPTGRGVTVRRRELPAVLAALREIASRLGVDVGDHSPPESGQCGSQA
jgi:hypothetical protein